MGMDNPGSLARTLIGAMKNKAVKQRDRNNELILDVLGFPGEFRNPLSTGFDGFFFSGKSLTSMTVSTRVDRYDKGRYTHDIVSEA